MQYWKGFVIDLRQIFDGMNVHIIAYMLFVYIEKQYFDTIDNLNFRCHVESMQEQLMNFN